MNFNNKKRTIKIKEKARQSNWTISFAIQIKDENKCKITRNSKTSNIVSYFYIFIQCFLSFNICSLFSPIHTYYVNSYVFTYNAFCVTLYSISVSEMIFFFLRENHLFVWMRIFVWNVVDLSIFCFERKHGQQDTVKNYRNFLLYIFVLFKFLLCLLQSEAKLSRLLYRQSFNR